MFSVLAHHPINIRIKFSPLRDIFMCKQIMVSLILLHLWFVEDVIAPG